MNTTTKHTRKDSDSAIISGIDVHLKGQTIVLDGVRYKQSELRQVFQDDLDATAATANAKGQWKGAIIAEHATATKMRSVKAALFAYLIATFGPNSQVLVDFGAKPRKAPKTAPAVKAQAVQQALLTRTARHTMGKRQRAKIKASFARGSAATAAPAPTAAPVAVAAPASNGANGTNGANVLGPTNGAPKAPPVASA